MRKPQGSYGPGDVRPIFFWNPKGANGWLSQWEPSVFVDQVGHKFVTAEQYMMASKALLFEDYEALDVIMASDNPKVAQRAGRKVRGFIEEVWNKHRIDIVVQGNVYKFSQNERLKKFLLGTAKRSLIEASPYDRIWGIGFKAADAFENEELWGMNLLGNAIMEARRQVRSLDA